MKIGEALTKIAEILQDPGIEADCTLVIYAYKKEIRHGVGKSVPKDAIRITTATSYQRVEGFTHEKWNEVVNRLGKFISEGVL